MSAKQTIEMVTELLKQGVQVFLTEDGWKAYITTVAEVNQIDDVAQESAV